MPMRTSNVGVMGSLVFGLRRSFHQLGEVRLELSSGKRINRWADDAPGVGAAMRYRELERNNTQYLRNAGSARSFLEAGDSALQSLGDHIARLRELVVRELGPLGSDQTREGAVEEVEALRNNVLNILNSQVQGSYLFAGQQTGRPPFELDGGSVLYHGDGQQQLVQLGPGHRIPVTLPGQELLGAPVATLLGRSDLQPRLAATDSLADLNGGDGVELGQFAVQDGSGSIATVDLAGATSVQDVLDRINATGLNLSARIDDAQEGIVLEGPGSITVRALPGDDSAADLGLAGTTSSGVLQGGDIRREFRDTTPLTSIRSLDGQLPLGSLRFDLAGGSQEIDLSGVNNIAQLRSLVGGIIPGMDVQVVDGAIQFELTGGGSFSVGSPMDDNTAAALGVVGSASPARLFGGFEDILSALASGDMDQLRQSLTEIEAVRSHVAAKNVGIGANQQELDRAEYLLRERAVDLQNQRSSVEDVDLIDAASRLSAAETSYQAALATSARLFQISLLDYL